MLTEPIAVALQVTDVQKDSLDQTYLRQMAAGLGVVDLLQRASKEIS